MHLSTGNPCDCEKIYLNRSYSNQDTAILPDRQATINALQLKDGKGLHNNNKVTFHRMPGHTGVKETKDLSKYMGLVQL